jgi:hypothetical protein
LLLETKTCLLQGGRAVLPGRLLLLLVWLQVRQGLLRDQSRRQTQHINDGIIYPNAPSILLLLV